MPLIYIFYFVYISEIPKHSSYGVNDNKVPSKITNIEAFDGLFITDGDTDQTLPEDMTILYQIFSTSFQTGLIDEDNERPYL